MKTSEARKLLRAKVIASKKRTHVELLDSLIKRRISITTLNSDTHPSRFIVDRYGRTSNETRRSCGSAPASKTRRLRRVSQPLSFRIPNAGHWPAFSLRVRRQAPAAALGAEFISVSGLRIDRSALFSDMRPSKRTSGVAAATLRPHAPMNSPRPAASGRLGFLHPSVLHPVRS